MRLQRSLHSRRIASACLLAAAALCLVLPPAAGPTAALPWLGLAGLGFMTLRAERTAERAQSPSAPRRAAPRPHGPAALRVPTAALQALSDPREPVASR